MDEAEALDCDVEECGPDPYEERRTEVLQMQLQFERQLQAQGDEADLDRRLQATHATRGHGDARLSELEELLSHDEWEPVEGRVALWRELRLLLESDDLLHSFLVAPADIEGTAEYWEPPPCKLCGSRLLPGRDGSFDFVAREFWCDWCADRETAARPTGGGAVGLVVLLRLSQAYDLMAGNIGLGRMGSCRASLAGGVGAQPRLTHASRFAPLPAPHMPAHSPSRAHASLKPLKSNKQVCHRHSKPPGGGIQPTCQGHPRSSQRPYKPLPRSGSPAARGGTPGAGGNR